jgi:hypothetical protein
VPALVVKEHARSPSGVRLLLGAGVSSLIVSGPFTKMKVNIRNILYQTTTMCGGFQAP